MVKQLMVVPEEVRRTETIQIGAIPVNSYQKTLGDEISAGKLTAADSLRLYRDMVVIREFETMLDQIKKMGAYEGIAYDHKGPAHLSIGQEAAAVGQSFLLGVDDQLRVRLLLVLEPSVLNRRDAPPMAFRQAAVPIIPSAPSSAPHHLRSASRLA